MGKIKTKYPLQIELDFMLFLQTSQLLRQSYLVTLQSGSLEYNHLQSSFGEFLQTFKINYESYMFFQGVHSEKEELVQIDWTLSLHEIEEHNRYIIIKVKSHTQYMKDLFYEQIEQIIQRVNTLEQKITHSQPILQEEEYQIKMPNQTLVHHSSSISQPIIYDKDLDIGVLFSQPIFDQQKHLEANMPVDFRSQLQRLYSALNNSYKPEITVQCEIATKQHLKHLIGYKKPKILHIICHGSSKGELEFEDDSKFSIGSLSAISSERIRQLLKSKREVMPKLVFINSCYSELIGNIFYQAGAKYCIMIDSQDKIEDEAAQIFSQNFYRNIFRGEKVGMAFQEAKDNVKIKHNSTNCCCMHSSKEVHKEGCRWLELSKSMGMIEAHKIYHIPSSKCTCQLRNINQHDLTCQWAQFALFHINNDFRIKDNATERFPKKASELPKYLPRRDKKKIMLLICCCFNFQEEGPSSNKETHIPHSESNKFKMLPENIEDTEPIYRLDKNVVFRTQIIDFSAPQLIQTHQKLQNSAVMGRQEELYFFMKYLRDNQFNIFFIYGHPGVGKTTFAVKAGTYLTERRVFQIYFWIDLFDIKGKDMFRNKFNEVTQLGYPFNKNSLNQVRNKPMVLVFDNIDQFILSSLQQFCQQLDSLKKEFIHSKFILTCQEKNLSILEDESIYMDNHTRIYELKALNLETATKALLTKLKNYLDISISYYDIRQLVTQKQQLRIPKIMENLSHSLSHTKGKVKLKTLKDKVMQLGKGDLAFNKLIGQNLNLLKVKCKESYDMLIFISQFSQGIDKNDFNILGSYERSEGNQNTESAMIDIPIDRNWKKRLAVLFQKNKEPSSQSRIDSESDTTDTLGLSFDRRQTSYFPEIAAPQSIPDQVFQSQSYFLQEVSRNRFVVRRFIRDFIWNKDRSDQNYYMKHIFVAYTAVLLDIYLNFLVTQKYVHESLIEYSDISQAGIFRYKDNNYIKSSLTQSIRYVEDYNSRFQRILKQQHALRQKIKSSDPSVFIMNHKLDFLHIYGYDWSKIYQYLLKNRRKEASVLINYLQRLIILIPTAMKIADMQESLIKYSIRQSIQLHAQIRNYSKPGHNLMLTLKLKLLKASSQVQKGDQNLLPNTQFQKDFHKNDLQGIDHNLLKTIQEQFGYEIEVLEIYQQYLKVKEFAKSNESSAKIGERIIESIRKLQEWLNNQFNEQVECQILISKRLLMLAMIFHKILQVSMKYPTNFKIINFKNNANLTNYARIALDAAKMFSIHRMTKLNLRAKLIALSINWEQLKTKVKHNQFSKELEKLRKLLRQCEDIYQDKKNNLIGLTVFDAILKKIKKEMKQRMWQESSNNLVILKAVPLCNKDNPILQNVVRKRQKYRRDLQSIFLNAEIDVSIKFQIMTGQKLEEEAKRTSSILLLNTNFRAQQQKIYLTCQNHDLSEQLIQINQDFVKNYPLSNTKLLILIGPNARDAFRKLDLLFPNIPSILSITTSSTAEFDEFEEYDEKELMNGQSSYELKKVIEHHNKVDDATIEFAQNFIKSLLNPKNYQKGIKDIYASLIHTCSHLFQEFTVDMRDSSKEIIRMSKGNFKDLSPGFRKTHNIDLQFQVKSGNIPCIYRKWKQLNQIFCQFSSKEQTKYIQLCGSNGIGKTTFVQEVSRLCIERGLFENGVYLISGRQIEEKFQSDFEAYITKTSQASTGMFNLQSFNKYANANFLLVIDDFHLIKPRTNGRYKMFMKKLFMKKVNILFVTHQSLKLKDIFPDIPIKKIKLEKMTEVELNIFAYSIFKPSNTAAIDEYEQEKRKRELNCAQIAKIYEKHIPTKYNNFVKMPEESMRKMISNRQ